MVQKNEVCDFVDFHPCIPDNPEPPLCEKGHGWSTACLKKNDCPDYKPTIVLTLEEIKKKYG